jgi:hypothetical protein
MPTFYNDVIEKSPYFTTLALYRELDLVEPITRTAIEAIVSDAAKEHQIKLMVFETFRSVARQEYLFQNGKTQLSQVGVHHYGLAADLVVVKNGQPTWDVDYSFLKPLAQRHGLVSGIDWHHPLMKNRFVDADHVQRINVEDQGKLFSGAWYPDEHYSAFTAKEEADMSSSSTVSVQVTMTEMSLVVTGQKTTGGLATVKISVDGNLRANLEGVPDGRYNASVPLPPPGKHIVSVQADNGVPIYSELTVPAPTA